jgi:hypothetical protein
MAQIFNTSNGQHVYLIESDVNSKELWLLLLEKLLGFCPAPTNQATRETSVIKLDVSAASLYVLSAKTDHKLTEQIFSQDVA